VEVVATLEDNWVNVLAVNESHVVWTHTGTVIDDERDRQILSAPKAGGAAEVIGVAESEPIAFAAAGTRVFFIDSPESFRSDVKSFSSAGGDEITHGTFERGPEMLQVDSSYVYWVGGSTFGDKSLSRSPHSSATPEELYGGEYVAEFAMGGDHFYYRDSSNGGLYQTSISGGEDATQLVEDLSLVRVLFAADASHFYWWASMLNDQSGLFRVPASGGPPQLLIEGSPREYALDSSGYYIAADIGVIRIAP
jgi:hypothetical protein